MKNCQLSDRPFHAQKVLRAAFKAKDYAAVGRTFNLYGKIAQDAALNVIRLATRGRGIQVGKNPEFGNRFLDFVLTKGPRILRIEVKYSLPQKGAALSRLVGQAEASVAEANGSTLIWSFAKPTPGQLVKVTEALGANASRVTIKSGIDGLFNFLKVFFAI